MLIRDETHKMGAADVGEKTCGKNREKLRILRRLLFSLPAECHSARRKRHVHSGCAALHRLWPLRRWLPGQCGDYGKKVLNEQV